MEEQTQEYRWAARCECYAGGPGHSPNSGRCGARSGEYHGKWYDGIRDDAAANSARCKQCKANPGCN